MPSEAIEAIALLNRFKSRYESKTYISFGIEAEKAAREVACLDLAIAALTELPELRRKAIAWDAVENHE